MKKNLFFGLVFLSLGLVAGIILTARLDLFSAAQSQSSGQPAAEELVVVVPEQDSSMENAVINVANTYGKAVVSISTEHTAKARKGGRRFYFGTPFGGGPSPFGGEGNFDRFFDDFFGGLPEMDMKQMGLGSGVIIDQKGHILTNEHVVNGADKITVKLPDGREFKAELKGKDSRSDLAVIKIDAKDLPVAKLGDSDELKIGQWVVAIGNPFGISMQNPEPTVTVGVVSALHRTLGRNLSVDRDYNDLIQTDAAINPGNSGGPLVNLKGEIVGINVAIFSTSGGYQGVGFAIPVNSARRIISRLIEGKKVLYGWLGVTVQDLTPDLASYFGLADTNGVLIAKVLDNAPAQKGGVKDGDIIKGLDGTPVSNVKELLTLVGKSEVGKRVKINLFRDKKEITIELKLGERPEKFDSQEEASGQGSSSGENWRGINAEELNPQNVMRFRIRQETGVVITGLEPGSPADEAGLVPGDIILEINKKPVKNMADYVNITNDAKGDCLIKSLRGYFLVKGE